MFRNNTWIHPHYRFGQSWIIMKVAEWFYVTKLVTHKHFHIIYVFEIVISFFFFFKNIFLSENLYYPCFKFNRSSSNGSKVVIFIAISFVSSKVFVRKNWKRKFVLTHCLLVYSRHHCLKSKH